VGHECTLYTSDRADPYCGTEGVQEQLYLTARNAVPVFWLAAFDPADQTIGANEDREWPYLVAARKAAVERLTNRRNAFKKLFPSVVVDIYDQFVGVVAKSSQPYIHLGAAGIGPLLGEPARAERRFALMLRAFQGPVSVWTSGPRIIFKLRDLNPGWKHILATNGIELRREETMHTASLAGGWWGEMPWEAPSQASKPTNHIRPWPTA